MLLTMKNAFISIMCCASCLSSSSTISTHTHIMWQHAYVLTYAMCASYATCSAMCTMWLLKWCDGSPLCISLILTNALIMPLRWCAVHIIITCASSSTTMHITNALTKCVVLCVVLSTHYVSLRVHPRAPLCISLMHSLSVLCYV
jgi:hypothetical protein